MTKDELKTMRQNNMAKARAAKEAKKGLQKREPAAPKAEMAVALPELAGLTVKDCPLDCTMDRCVITQCGICGHPHKSGIQPAHKLDPAILERYNDARKYLAAIEFEREQQSK